MTGSVVDSRAAAPGPPRGPASAAGLASAAVAPPVELTDQHGSPYSLTDALVTGPVLLVFFPFAFSGVCTGEMAALVQLEGELAAAGTSLVAVSCDQLFALRVFADQQGVRFPVLSDFWPHGDLARAYGVFDAERGCSLRGSFLIDTAGIVRWSVVNPVAAGRDVASHLAAALDLAASSA